MPEDIKVGDDTPYTSNPQEDEFLVEARNLYQKDYDAIRVNHEWMADDIRFFALDQWDQIDRQEREALRRPVITEDHLGPAVRQITNDMRMNKPSVKVRPIDDEADPEIAKLYEGLIRNIEQQSFASGGNAYVRAGENQVICGQGNFRIITEYADDDTFDQDIRIRPIRSGTAVVWDEDAESPTRDDAKRCWILTWMSKNLFDETYPGKSDLSWETPQNRSWYSYWYRRDEILVAEYFYKEPKKKTLWRMADDRVIDVTDLDDEAREAMVRAQAEEAEALGMPMPPLPEAREVDSSKVMRAVINGGSILEEPREWPGRYIPVINVMGEEVFLNDSRNVRGLIRTAKDSQRMINYHNSAAIEHVALSPKQPYLGTTTQFAGLEGEWQLANRQNSPYLRYKADPQAPGPPTREGGPQIPTALMALKEQAVQGLQRSMNIFPSATGEMSEEVSGVAIHKRDMQGDVANFHFHDNLNAAITYCGKQLLDLIPRIYDGERIIRILGEDDAEEMVEINVLEPDGSIKNDLAAGKYDVLMVPGPSFTTKRQEAAEGMTKFIQAAPDQATLIMDLLVKNLDWPGADEIYERMRKQAISQGLVEPDPDKGEQPPPPPPPSPEMVLAEAEQMKAQADLLNAQSRQMEARTKLGGTIASSRRDMAETERAEADAEGKQIENVQALMEMVMASEEVQLALRTAAERAITTLNAGPIGPNGAPASLA